MERARAGVTRAGALRLARLVLPRPARLLEAPARGRRGGQGLQSAPADGPVLHPPQPPQADHRRRHASASSRACASPTAGGGKKGHEPWRDTGLVRRRPAGGGSRCRLCRELGSRRHEADPEVGAARSPDIDCAGGSGGGAGDQRRARHVSHLPVRPVHRLHGAAQPLAHRRLFRRHHLLCAGAGRGGARRRRRAPPRAGLERRAGPAADGSGGLPLAGRGRASGSSSGTARCCTPRPRWRTGAGPASAPPTSTWRAGRPIGSSTWSSRTRASPKPWRRCIWRISPTRPRSFPARHPPPAGAATCARAAWAQR